jgi:peptidoglycan/LPS O-acetylase OafA/YrhL
MELPNHDDGMTAVPPAASAARDPIPGSRRIPALDGLRGIAILMVVACHFFPDHVLRGMPQTVVSSLGAGGVLLFFLLSGYLIFRNLQRQSLRVFLARRFFKLFPAYWVNILVILLIGILLPDYPKFSLFAYASNFFLMPDVFRQDLISGVFWTLVIEIKFYAIVALQYYFFANRHVLAVPAAIMAANLVFWSVFGRGSVLLSYLPVFYVGIEIYRAEAEGWSPPACARLASVAAIVAASMLLFVQHSTAFYTALYVAGQASLFILVLRAMWGPAWLGFFGRISYSLYLYHGVLGFELFRSFDRAAPTWVLLLAACAASLLAAYLSFVWIEEPGVNFGKRLERRLWPRPAIPA